MDADGASKTKVRLRVCRSAGNDALKDFPLEFEGTRAYLVWDTVSVGNLLLKARVELNPKFIRRLDGRGYHYYYRGRITLPCPENN
jgi:hypothetical protein